MNKSQTLVTKLSVITLLAATFFILPQQTFAKTSGSSAYLSGESDGSFPIIPLKNEDKRIHILQKFLSLHNSPLSDYAETFISEADKNDIDWKLLPAISGVESTFGINIPVNSYNGWGFGIYGDNTRRFESWKEAISTISKALREDYMNKWGATNVYEIGRIYAASPTWASRVSYFMDQIDSSAKVSADQNQTLSLSL